MTVTKSDKATAIVGTAPNYRSHIEPGTRGNEAERQGRSVTLDYHLLSRNLIVSLDKTDRNTSHYDILRTKILRKMSVNGWKKIAITSPRAGAGKTVTAINLAFGVAQTVTNSAIAIDLDLRRPSFGRYLGLDTVNPSLSDFISGGATLDDVTLKPDFPRLNFVINNQPIQNASECLGSEEVIELVTRFDDPTSNMISIIDLPPLLEVDDALVVMPHVDCVLLVISAGQSTPSELLECQRLLEDYNLVGTVLNRSNTNHNDYY